MTKAKRGKKLVESPAPRPLSEAALKQKLLLLEQKKKLRDSLPHLYKFPHYSWSREFFEATDKVCLLTAANQIGKSSTQIRKVIHWATEPSLWPKLWRTPPTQFHYYYPTAALATVEFDTKWMQFLPQNGMEKDPKYGWKMKKSGGYIHSIEFNSGVNVYFKQYSQSATALQAATVYYVALDEECPVELWSELAFRVAATQGYMSMVFTATLGQDFWRQVMEPSEDEKELLPQARKWQVSTYDCLKYEDGSPSHWTVPMIEELKAKCKDRDEIQKRVYGKFVGITKYDRIYHAFEIQKHLHEPGPPPENYVVYMGVDVGSGGAQGHPSSIVCLAVAPDFKRARVHRCWRGDGIETTAGDVIDKVLEFKDQLSREGLPVVAIYYDYSCADFFSLAQRIQLPVNPADKGVERGVGMINTLFRNNMLTVVNDVEGQKLATELMRVSTQVNKSKRADDLCFVAGTRIATPQGDLPIESLREGDWVITPSGQRRVTATGSRLSPVMTWNGITGTENHPFVTKRSGLTPLRELSSPEEVRRFSCAELIRWHVLKKWNSWVLPTVSWEGRESIISLTTSSRQPEKGPKGFMSLFGSIIAERRFLLAVMCIIKTAIPLITALRTWSVYRASNTMRFLRTGIGKRIESTWLKFAKRRPSGIAQKRGVSGIARMLKTRFGQGRSLSATAWTAGKNTSLPNRWGSFAVTLAGRATLGSEKLQGITLTERLEILTPIARPMIAFAGYAGLPLRGFGARVVFAHPLAKINTTTAFETRGVERVYNLTVEEDHLYYANGYLVSNCDALRYSASKAPWDWSGKQPDSEVAQSVLLSEEEHKKARKQFVLINEAKAEELRIEAEFEEIESLLHDY